MRRPTLLLIAAAATLTAGAAHAEPARISVSLGPQVVEEAETLGQRDIDQQVERLTEVLHRELSRDAAFDGARVEVTLVRLEPNRPTWEQMRREPGLDPIRSISVGGAEIEGRVTLANGRSAPVSHRWFSTSLADVWGLGTWSDAERAYDRLARKMVREL